MKSILNIPDELNARIQEIKKELALPGAVAVLKRLVEEWDKPKPEPVFPVEPDQPPAPLPFTSAKVTKVPEPDPPGMGYAFENTGGFLLAEDPHGPAICMDKDSAYAWIRAGEDKGQMNPWSVRPVKPTSVDVQSLERHYAMKQWNEVVSALPPGTIFLDEYKKRYLTTRRSG